MDKRHFRKMQITQKVRKTPENQWFSGVFELRGKDLNQRPPGYEIVKKLTISFTACVCFVFCVVCGIIQNYLAHLFLTCVFLRIFNGQIMDKVIGFYSRSLRIFFACFVQNSWVIGFSDSPKKFPKHSLGDYELSYGCIQQTDQKRAYFICRFNSSFVAVFAINTSFEILFWAVLSLWMLKLFGSAIMNGFSFIEKSEVGGLPFPDRVLFAPW